MKRAVAIGVVLLAIVAGCSPEATRTRGGGPGADVGNRGPGLPEIHGPVSNPSFETPKVGRASEK